jgi:hypothetical protein
MEDMLTFQQLIELLMTNTWGVIFLYLYIRERKRVTEVVENHMADLRSLAGIVPLLQQRHPPTVVKKDTGEVKAVSLPTQK